MTKQEQQAVETEINEERSREFVGELTNALLDMGCGHWLVGKRVEDDEAILEFIGNPPLEVRIKQCPSAQNARK